MRKVREECLSALFSFLGVQGCFCKVALVEEKANFIREYVDNHPVPLSVWERDQVPVFISFRGRSV